MSHHSRHNKTHEAHPTTSSAAATSAPMANNKSCTAEPDAGCCQPAADRIRVRTYEISKSRNGGPGDALADWIQAEREVAVGRDAKS